MDLDVRPPSLVLPGAWSPAWTQALDRDPSDMSVASPDSSGGSLRLEGDFSLDQSDRFDPQNGVLVSKASSDDAAAASDSDEESTLSDDFYSIISDQDADVTVSPESETVELEDELVSPYSAEPQPLSARQSLKLKGTSHAGVALSHEAPSEASPSCSTHIPPQPTQLPSEMSNISLSTSSLTSSSSGPARETSPSSRRSSSTCSSRSIAFRKNVPSSNSLYPGYPGLHYAHLDRDFDMSSESVPYSPKPSSSVSPRSIRRKRVNDDAGPSNSLNFPQPGGDEPWTLALEPAMTSTAASTASTASRSSLSLSTELSTPSPQSGEILERYLASLAPPLTFNPMPHQSPTLYPGNTLYDIHTQIATQRTTNAIYTPSPLDDALFNHTVPGYAPHSAGEKKSKNVIKKTKVLYGKFKNLLGSKGPKPVQARLSEEGRTTVVTVEPPYAVEESPGLSPTAKTFFSPASSRTSWSLPRPGFPRQGKSSTPSIARSSTTEVAQNHPSGSMDGIHPYGSQATPRTSKEIRSRRRFSMPTFAGQSAAGSNGSAPQSLNTLSRPGRREHVGSLISSLYNHAA